MSCRIAGGPAWAKPLDNATWNKHFNKTEGSACTAGAGHGLQNRWDLREPLVWWVRFPCTSASFRQLNLPNSTPNSPKQQHSYEPHRSFDPNCLTC